MILQAKVLYKKQNGHLQLDSDSLKFTLIDNQQQQQPSIIKIGQIKGIFVNAPGSAKCLLRVVTRDEQAHLFQFIDSQTAIQDRDQFKDRISILINALTLGASTTATGASSTLSADDIRRRQMLLAQNASLRRLHRDLVVSGKHLSEEEFWAIRGTLLVEQAELERQQTGMSTAIVHDVRPSTTNAEGSDIKYTLTPEIIQSIFLHHPKSECSI
jgi:transcription initiation factor TFIIH subunit 1